MCDWGGSEVLDYCGICLAKYFFGNTCASASASASASDCKPRRYMLVLYPEIMPTYPRFTGAERIAKS